MITMMMTMTNQKKVEEDNSKFKARDLTLGL